MIESRYIIDGASFVLFNSFCHRECIVVGPAQSGVAFAPNSWAGAARTPPGVGSPWTGCTQGGVVPDALQPLWASPPSVGRLRAVLGRASVEVRCAQGGSRSCAGGGCGSTFG